MAAVDAQDAVAFRDLGLPEALVAALNDAGMETAFPIQSATIADALAGRDVLGKARTGSGKTLGFGLPAIARLAETGRASALKPRAIVLVPTRELAMQVNDALEPFAHAMHVSLRLVAGGLSMSKQIRSLERGVHLIVATPGRLADLVRRGHADLSETRLVILDEADHMADMGFMDEIEEILAGVPAGGQRLLFSATLDGDVDRIVKKYMEDPVLHDVTDGDDQPSTMKHIVLNVPPHAKYQMATRIAARQGRTIIFVRTKLACDRIAEEMREAGVLAVALHGDKTQFDRNHAITGFRAGQIPVLVATDVAARGIHVDHVDLVLQLDPPADPKDYTHRSGRTARAGQEGLVVTLALPHQRRTVDRLIERAGVDATFRKVRGEDEESLRTLSDLTGAQEPSGVPVAEPRAPRGQFDRGGRGGRYERGGRGERGPARGDRGRRPTHSRAAHTGGFTPQHESAKAREQIERREQQLAAREQELALREQRLADRERQAAQEPPPARREERRPPQRQRDDRRDDRRDDWEPRRSAPRSSGGGRPSTGSRPPSAGAPGRKPRHSKSDGGWNSERDSAGRSTGTAPRSGARSTGRDAGRKDDRWADRGASRGDDRGTGRPKRAESGDGAAGRGARGPSKDGYGAGSGKSGGAGGSKAGKSGGKSSGKSGKAGKGSKGTKGGAPGRRGKPRPKNKN